MKTKENVKAVERIVKLGVISALLVFEIFTADAQDYASMVDTRIGSKGEGHNFVGACYPFGMVQFSPNYFHPQRGFSILQMNGAGCANFGNFPVLPLLGNLSASPNDMNSFPAFKKINDAHAGYLSVTMEDKTLVELTVNNRIGVAKFTFDEDAEEGTILIGSGVSATFVNNAKVQITSNQTCEGFAEGGEFCGHKTGYRVYFAAEFDTPANSSGTWMKNKLIESGEQAYREKSGAYFSFDLNDKKEIGYRIAVSFVSVENAKENLAAGTTYDCFADYKQHAEQVWNENLGKIAVKSENYDRKVQFYTHFYRCLLHPNIVSDVNGEYMGADFKVHKTKNRDYYSSFSVWDTYRTQCQLVTMLYPEEASDMMQSVVDFAEQAGGLGRWVLANIETGIMQGDPTSILIANSYAFGAKNFDVEKAFEYMKKGATIPLLHSQDIEVRPQLADYLKYGYNPRSSLLLEYTSADFFNRAICRSGIR